jgi:opacity protein-like surface antigen
MTTNILPCPKASQPTAQCPAWSRLILLVSLLLLSGGAAQAQSDFGIWTEVGVEKKINKKWNVGLDAEWRTRDNASKTDRWDVGVGTEYKITDWLKADAGYDFLYDKRIKTTYHDDGTPNKEAKFWQPRHRFHVSLTGGVDLGRWQLRLRERWQYTYRPEKTVSERYDYDQEDYDDEEKTYSGKGTNVLRSRLQVGYNVPHSGLEPYANAELFNAWNVEKVRYTVGLGWKVTKHHVVGISYKYQKTYDDKDDEDSNRHILGLDYTFKF